MTFTEEDKQLLIAERAAIMHYDGGLSWFAAESSAREIVERMTRVQLTLFNEGNNGA